MVVTTQSGSLAYSVVAVVHNVVAVAHSVVAVAHNVVAVAHSVVAVAHSVVTVAHSVVAVAHFFFCSHVKHIKYNNLPVLSFQIAMHVVEIDPVIVDIARQWFGFSEDSNLNVHIADGLDFIHKAAQEGMCGCVQFRSTFKIIGFLKLNIHK